MRVRRIRLNDDAAVLAMWNETQAVMAPNYPAGFSFPPLANTQQARKLYAHASLIGAIVTEDVDDIPIACLLVKKRGDTNEEVFGFFVKFVRNPNNSVNQVETRRRFRRAGKLVLEAWFNDALARGVPRCMGDYPAGTSDTGRTVFNEMSAANGVQGNTVVRPGWIRYIITPEQGLIGLAGVGNG